jgi:hypothetical protein
MSKRFAALVFAGSLGLTSGAFAADLPVRAPVEPVFSWTGWYIGGNIGWGWGPDQVNIAPSPDAVLPRFGRPPFGPAQHHPG